MYEEPAAENRDRKRDVNGKEKQEHAIPQRCKSCADLAYCDTDFCIHWWH